MFKRTQAKCRHSRADGIVQEVMTLLSGERREVGRKSGHSGRCWPGDKAPMCELFLADPAAPHLVSQARHTFTFQLFKHSCFCEFYEKISFILHSQWDSFTHTQDKSKFSKSEVFS